MHWRKPGELKWMSSQISPYFNLQEGNWNITRIINSKQTINLLEGGYITSYANNNLSWLSVIGVAVLVSMQVFVSPIWRRSTQTHTKKNHWKPEQEDRYTSQETEETKKLHYGKKSISNVHLTVFWGGVFRLPRSHYPAGIQRYFQQYIKKKNTKSIVLFNLLELINNAWLNNVISNCSLELKHLGWITLQCIDHFCVRI